MKKNNTNIALILFIIICAIIVRVLPWRVPGFTSQLAIIVLSGFYFRNKSIAVFIPFLTLFVSDLVYELLYQFGFSEIYGFYGYSQIVNYMLLLSLIVIPILLKKISLKNIIMGSIATPTVFYFTSNTSVWLMGGGYAHPKTFAGYSLTMIEGIPFYLTSLMSTFLFCIAFYTLSVYGLKQSVAMIKK